MTDLVTCRSRVSQILTFVDEDGPVVGSAMQRLVEESQCPQGHPLPLASILPLVRADERGQYRLNGSGQAWMLETGRPPSEWQNEVPPSTPPLRHWQVEALDAWAAHGRHGVIEAVTGTGKSRVGIEAVREAIRHDFSCLVVVPTVELVSQWATALRQHRIASVATTAEGARPSLDRYDVLVTTVQAIYSAPPSRADGKVLLIADECHRYGSEQWSRVLHGSYRRRLGLTATFERNDDGIDKLRTYFGGECVYHIGFGRAIADGVIARYSLDLVPVQLKAAERAEYDEAHDTVVESRLELLQCGLPERPFGEFMSAVQAAADDDTEPALRDLARRYLQAFSRRVDVLAGARAKIDAARRLSSAVRSSRGTLIFTSRVGAAEEIAQVLRQNGVAAAAVHSELSHAERKDRLAELRAGKLRAVVAPTVLDEGVDVPDVDLGVVLGGSRSRRQMIQRMGRVLRLKKDGRAARFVLVYAAGTVEDVTMSTGEEGCLDLLIKHADSVRHGAATNTAAGGGPPPPAQVRTGVATEAPSSCPPELVASPQTTPDKLPTDAMPKPATPVPSGFDSAASEGSVSLHVSSSKSREGQQCVDVCHRLPLIRFSPHRRPRKS